MRVIRPLRQRIWEQTQEAVISDLARDVPAVAVPAASTYRVYHDPPIHRARGQPDGHRHLIVRFEERD
eukprot:2464071-Alexandrium_andersonii.AAC.1